MRWGRERDNSKKQKCYWKNINDENAFLKPLALENESDKGKKIWLKWELKT